MPNKVLESLRDLLKSSDDEQAGISVDDLMKSIDDPELGLDDETKSLIKANPEKFAPLIAKGRVFTPGVGWGPRHNMSDDDEDDEGGDKDKGDGKGEGDDYEGLKKYLKSGKGKKNLERFMKEVKKSDSSMGDLFKSMTDVTDYDDPDDLESASAVLIEGTGIFKAFRDFASQYGEFGENLAKSMVDLEEKVENLEGLIQYNTELAKAIGGVIGQLSESINGISSQPNPVKGMVKSMIPQIPSGNNRDAVLAKANQVGIAGIKKALVKAAKEDTDENIRADAMKAITSVESCFGNFELLPDGALKTINNVLEAN